MSKPLSRGVHHLALNTDDMKMTLDFYLRVLGMPLVHALKVPPGLGTGPGNRGNPPFENIRHYFLDAGGDSLLAFFEIPKGAKPRGDRDAIGTMQHVSFAVSEQKFNDVLNRIRNARIEYLGPVNVGCETYSIYFLDPNGIRLEFSHQKDRAAHPDRRPGMAANRGRAPARAPPGREIHPFTEAKWTSETTSNATTPA
ncbi:MAG: VOC family protein [Betaproteobacteria bacterium]|nr:MAG: VOC family protein [Betaproteobacteria bacterium]